MTEQLSIMIAAAKAGGQQLKQWYGKSLTIQNKSTLADFRTQADVASEQAVIAELQQHYPEYSIYAEESGEHATDSEYTFIIDPLDGTNNFSLTLPNFSVSIGLMKGENTIAGVIYNPINNHLYHASIGDGAFFTVADGEPTQIQVGAVATIPESTVSFGMGYEGDPAINRAAVAYLEDRNLKRAMSNWSPAMDLALLASGKLEGFVCNNNDVYDNAAGKLLVKEAGGIILDWSGNQEVDEMSCEYIAACTPELGRLLVEAVQQAK